MRTRLPSIALVLLLAGCTAVKSTIHLSEAEAALRRAGEFNAEEIAAYEYTMALRYLEKAKEEAGHSDFGMSTALSKKSMEWSDKAIIFIERGGPMNDVEDLSNVPDLAPPPEPVDAPAPDPLFEPADPTPQPLPAPEPAPEPEPEPGDEFEVEDDFDWENE